jgi:hypothetical protein
MKMVEFNTGDNIVTVIVGIDGSPPPQDIQMNMQETVNMRVDQSLDFNINRDSVTLTLTENPTIEQRGMLGPGVLYIATFDVNLGSMEVNQKVVNAAHNTVVEKMTNTGFNVSGTATVWDGNIQQ